MKEIEATINEMNKIELAFFVKYRLSTYLPITQNIIEKELRRRHFDFRQVNAIVRIHEFNNRNKEIKGACPRCSSTKLFTREVDKFASYTQNRIWFDPTNYRTDIEKEQDVICIVCGYDIKNGEKSNWITRLFRKLKNTVPNNA